MYRSTILTALAVGNTFPSPYMLADAEAWIKTALSAPQSYFFAVCRRSDDAFAGGMGLEVLGDVQYRTLELGYWLGWDYWGQGVATDAVGGLTAWAFENGMSTAPTRHEDGHQEQY